MAGPAQARGEQSAVVALGKGTANLQVFGLLETRLLGKQAGELIVASETLEAHVFLQDGRIAWAYSNENRGLFLRELQEIAQIDEDTLREVLDECRREKRHVAETLITWGLATEKDVRRALWVQIGATLQSITRTQAPEAIFLRRASENYAKELTFTLDEFERERFSSPPSAEDPALLEQEAVLQQQLQESMPKALWGRLLRQGNHSKSGGALNIVAEILAEIGVFECAHRDARGWVLGVRRPEGYFFCGLRPDALLSKARKTLSAEPMPPGSARELHLGALRPAEELPHRDSLRAIFDQFAQLAGVCVEQSRELFFKERDGVPATFREDVQRASLLLHVGVSDFSIPFQGETKPGILSGIRLVLPEYQLFGAAIGEKEQIWLALCPTVLEGLGWGLLANTLRTLRHETP